MDVEGVQEARGQLVGALGGVPGSHHGEPRAGRIEQLQLGPVFAQDLCRQLLDVHLLLLMVDQALVDRGQALVAPVDVAHEAQHVRLPGLPQLGLAARGVLGTIVLPGIRRRSRHFSRLGLFRELFRLGRRVLGVRLRLDLRILSGRLGRLRASLLGGLRLLGGRGAGLVHGQIGCLGRQGREGHGARCVGRARGGAGGTGSLGVPRLLGLGRQAPQRRREVLVVLL
mmetsp:Transcript_88649/g.246145  ORF Transcript_88649/g.246145 Transcript_88649/m.246145 type:complete len:227 (+) Transcript_88649:1513-2193(+)